ncbi:MAG: tripartite tricarboxylate transporter permease [Acidobacteria bacterium]|nr:tripartite tricarboxylate transporter permease [Acidobacteriota bacterium]
MIELLLDNLVMLTQWEVWALLVAGVTAGILIGAVPGIGPSVGVAVLLPITMKWDPALALSFLGTLYPAAAYGGSISAILLNIPGETGAAATMMDGFPLSQQGKSAVALGISATASFIGGMVGVISLIFFSPWLADVAIKFGPAEYFVLALFGLSIISVVVRQSTLKGLISAGLGLAFSTVGYDQVTGNLRYTFGTLYLQDGIPFIQALVGMFAVSQAVLMAESGQTISRMEKLGGRILDGLRATLSSPWNVIRSSVIGTFIGALPGPGMSVATFVAYGEAARSDKTGTFGSGNVDGVIAPETAKNAAIIGELIPALSLGIPGGAAAAVFMGAMLVHGVAPGPMVFKTSAHVIATLMICLTMATFMILVIGLLCAPFFARVTLVSNQIIVPSILVLSFMGSYGVRNSLEDVVLTLFFGIVGYVMIKTGYPTVPFILGLILGPIAEQGMQRALLLSDGSVKVFFHSPTSVILWTGILAALLYPIVGPLWRRISLAKTST